MQKPKTIINFLLSCAVDDEVYRFEVKSLPQGSVCLFGGQYSTGGISFKTLNIPPETCTVPKPKSTGKQYVNPECHRILYIKNIYECIFLQE